MSDCEQIAQVTHVKTETMSDSLRLLMINERAARDKWASCSVFFGLLLFRSQKRVICQKILKLKSYFLVHFYSFFVSFLKNRAIRSFLLFYVMSDVSQSLRSLTKNERYEWIAQVAHQKWANEQIDYVAHQKWANCSVYFYRITHLLIIRSFFSQKTSDLLRKPMSEVPTLAGSYLVVPRVRLWRYTSESHLEGPLIVS